MTTRNTIDDLPIDAVESMLAKDSMSIELLEDLIATTTDPEKRKLLVIALERLLEKEKEKIRRLEAELAAARISAKRTEECIQHLREALEEHDFPSTPHA